jgi:hypothetical protein
MKTSSLAVVAAMSAMALGTACGSNPDESDGDQVFTRTIAQVQPDGTVVWGRTEQVTASQQRAEGQARLAGGSHSVDVSGRSNGLTTQSVNSDSECADADNWLFSNNNWSGNELCLYGTSPFTTCASLSSFSYPGGGDWQYKVESFYTGGESGYFTDGDLVCPSTGSWTTYTQYGTTCATSSAGICFTD